MTGICQTRNEMQMTGSRLSDASLLSPHLQVVHEAVHLSGLEHGEHGLADVERVPPVVVLDRPVVLLHAQDPPAQRLSRFNSLQLSSKEKQLTGIWPQWTRGLLAQLH